MGGVLVPSWTEWAGSHTVPRPEGLSQAVGGPSSPDFWLVNSRT